MLHKNAYISNDLERRQPKQSQKEISKRKLKIKHFTYDIPRIDNASSSSMGASSFKNNSINEHERDLFRPDEVENLNLIYFCQKYLPRNAPQQNLDSEMQSIEQRKKEEINSLLVYRDELKLINSWKQNSAPIKLSLSTLKQKSKLQSVMMEKKSVMQKQIKQTEIQSELLTYYLNMMKEKSAQKSYLSGEDVLDINKEEELIIKNLEMETAHLIKELGEEQRKNERVIIAIKEEIQELRIMIKQKEDKLRDLKAKICTMYIKLHNRNNSGLGQKNKDRNMSISVKKFNNLQHYSIREVFIGSNSFKNFSKEVIEKVNSDEELVKIRFFTSFIHPETRTPREKFTFQCCYKNRQGMIHDQNAQDSSDTQMTRDKISQENDRFQQVDARYLLSMKFFYKSKIVGVQCRVKTEKGNRHLQIGNCAPHIEHELLTLVNKNLVTMGSFWHSRQMIGISVWYLDKKSLNSSRSSQKMLGVSYDTERLKGRKKTQKTSGAYDQYYA